MAFFDTFTNPLEGMNIFGAKAPSYLPSLLDQNEINKLKQQSLVQGLLGTAATYLAQPKTQGYGSALPYLGKAFLGGMQQSQDVYDQATKDYLVKQQLEQAKLKKQYIDKYASEHPEIASMINAFPEAMPKILESTYKQDIPNSYQEYTLAKTKEGYKGSYDDWMKLRQVYAGETAAYATKPVPPTQPQPFVPSTQQSVSVSVTAPNGKVYNFPDKASADKFKAQIGVK